MKRQAWVMFWVLGAIWGSSFLLIRIGVGELRPVEVVFIRTAIAAVGLSAVIAFRRVRVPTDWANIRALIIIGLGNVVAPFILISWGEQHISSGMAAVLQSTAALFTLVIAHFAFDDERMSIPKVAGLIVGFIGVVVLFSTEINLGGGESAASADSGISLSLLGQLAIVVASLFYATFSTYSRTIIKGKVEPIVMAAGTMITGAIATAPLTFLTEGGFTPFNQAISPDVINAMVVLGALNTFVAYLFYYFIVRELGASKASMVTYIVPIVGLVLGAVFLQEEVGPTLIFGAGLIFTGIAIVNLWRRPQQAKGIQQPIVESTPVRES